MFEIEFDIAIDFLKLILKMYAILDIETTGGQFNEEELPKSLFINLMVMK
jgi:hypothetical protein